MDAPLDCNVEDEQFFECILWKQILKKTLVLFNKNKNFILNFKVVQGQKNFHNILFKNGQL